MGASSDPTVDSARAVLGNETFLRQQIEITRRCLAGDLEVFHNEFDACVRVAEQVVQQVLRVEVWQFVAQPAALADNCWAMQRRKSAKQGFHLCAWRPIRSTFGAKASILPTAIGKLAVTLTRNGTAT